MRHSKSWIKVFGLTVMAALGLMASTAAVAQAEKLANGGKEAVFQIQGGSALLATLTAASEGQVQILEPGRDLTIRCNNLDLLEGKINSAKEALVRITYLECVAFNLSSGSELSCELIGGAIATALRALPKTHEGKSYILLEGDPTTSIGMIEYKSGTECPLPLKSPISGTVIGEVTAAEGGGQLLQFNNTIRELFNDKINYGTFQLILDASMVLELTGAHEGMSLGIL